MKKIDDSVKRILAEGLAERLKILFHFVGGMTQPGDEGISDLELLKETKKDLEDRLSMHAAIGIVNPMNYELKQSEGEQKLKRIRVLINFVETLVDTDKAIQEARKKQADGQKFAEMMDNIL